MIHKIKILDDVVVKHILNFYEFCEFRDGESTGPKDKKVKNNQELYDEVHKPALNKLVLDKLYGNRTLTDGLLGYRFVPPLFLKYDEGCHYSFHNDFYFQNDSIKTDYSITIFLSDPSEYTGGELCIKVGDQEIEFKEPPGCAIVYPTGLWHTVRPITSGTRKVVVSWFESIIADDSIRSACYELSQLMERSLDENCEETLIRDQQLAIENIRFNLIRKHGKF